MLKTILGFQNTYNLETNSLLFTISQQFKSYHKVNTHH